MKLLINKIIDEKLEEGRLYFHCIECGIVYDDKERTKPLINIYYLLGKRTIPRQFNGYNISSSVCERCYYKKRKEILGR